MLDASALVARRFPGSNVAEVGWSSVARTVRPGGIGARHVTSSAVSGEQRLVVCPARASRTEVAGGGAERSAH